MIPRSTRASRVMCGGLAADMLWRGKSDCALSTSGVVRFLRRGEQRTRARVRSAAIAFAFVILFAVAAQAAEVIPPKPNRYFNDYAGVVSQSAALRFNEQLAQFERDTSDQVVVAIFPKMQSDSDIADYTQRVAQAWGVGQKERRNGVVLFVFLQDRKMIVQVGYGLEGALPDATAFDITEYQMKPRFIAGDYEGGLRIGIDSICGAIKGEYSSKTETVAKEKRHRRSLVLPLVLLFLIPLSLLFGLHRTARRGFAYSKAGVHWTIDWREVFFFWLSLLLSGRSGNGGGESSSSS